MTYATIVSGDVRFCVSGSPDWVGEMITLVLAAVADRQARRP